MKLLDLFCGAGGAGEGYRRAIGIDWMTRDELSQAIPPRLYRMDRAANNEAFRGAAMKPKLDPAATIKAYKKLVKDLQAQVKELQEERDAAAELCAKQLEKIKRLEKKMKYDELPY